MAERERCVLATTQNKDGQWVPAIPLPFYSLLWTRCGCGRRFWTEAGYRGHFALVHILRLLTPGTREKPRSHLRGFSLPERLPEPISGCYGAGAGHAEPIAWRQGVACERPA